MPLAPGTKLGPYEIQSPLGAGGMGEVYRARDTRLERTVAIKILPAQFSSDPVRKQRFEREAKTISSLNHPHICVLYDVGHQDGMDYLVMECVEGETLSKRLEKGPLPLDQALKYGAQIADALDKAHRSGVVHRDLKPGNIMLTATGAKLLDFGLAKPVVPLTSVATLTAAVTQSSPMTEQGAIVGTFQYMSPEQVEGKEVDARSDIFSLGGMLYEMVTGKRAFEGKSQLSVASAILEKEPEPISVAKPMTPPALDHAVKKCLAKLPNERWQSASDVASELKWIAESGGQTGTLAPAGPQKIGRKWLALLAVTVALIVAGVAGFFAGQWTKRAASSGPATFVPINFRPEAVFNARFAPDGNTVVFSAAAEGNIPQLFVHRNDYPAPQRMGLPGTQLLSISSKGELAVLIGARYIAGTIFIGTLARMDLGGGAPREILQNVQYADWSPDGAGLAIIREVNGKSRLEYPIGTVLFEVPGYLSDLRFSPRGDQIAFFEHPLRYDNRGSIDVVDLRGHIQVLAEGYSGEEGLAWANDGGMVYFSASRTREHSYVIHAVTASGKPRVVLGGLQPLWVLDTNSRGNLLVGQYTHYYRLVALAPESKVERDLSWLDRSLLPRLSADGQWVLFTESSTGSNYTLLLGKTDGSPVVRLGDGRALGISPDGAWALSMVPGPPMQLVLYPTGAGERRLLERGKLENYESAQFFPDGKRVLACGNEPGHPTRCYVQDVGGGAPQPSTPEGTSRGFVSPDGKAVLALGAGGQYFLYPIASGPPQKVPGLTEEDIIIRWSADGRSVLVFRTSGVPARIEAVNLSTGRRTFLREVAPAERAGVLRIASIAIADNGKSYAYSYYRSLARLAIVDGVK